MYSSEGGVALDLMFQKGFPIEIWKHFSIKLLNCIILGQKLLYILD